MTVAMRFVPLLLIASEAAASPCEVTIPRAPDDVRAVCEVYPKDSGGCALGGGRPSGFVLLTMLGAALVAAFRRRSHS